MNAHSPAILGSLIDGAAAALGSGGRDLVDPQDGSVIGTVREAGEAGVAAAVASANAAFRAHRKATVFQRITWLNAAASAIEANADELARLISRDVGKPMRLARFEVGRGSEFMRASAATLSTIGGELVPVDAARNGAGAIGMVRHIPYGVVAAVTPFNAPINLLVQKIAPAIAAGNAVIAKPAPAGLRTALRLAELLIAAGWPKGLFNVLSGDRETALALVGHPDVRAVSFTGGTAAGDALARAAGAKKFLAELGSNAANIVFADAEDLAVAAQKIAGAGFEASGQQCISAQRVLVERKALDRFLPAFVAAAKALKVGLANDEKADIGPVIHSAAADRIMDMVRDAAAKGAELVLEPKREGCTVTPGILLAASRDARLWQEEVFGPVVVVVPFETAREALELANDSAFGLQGAVFTGSLGTALQFADDFDVGALWVNEASRFRLDMYPFGGVKQSGVGREGVRYAIEEMSQLKFIGIRS